MTKAPKLNLTSCSAFWSSSSVIQPVSSPSTSEQVLVTIFHLLFERRAFCPHPQCSRDCLSMGIDAGYWVRISLTRSRLGTRPMGDLDHIQIDASEPVNTTWCRAAAQMAIASDQKPSFLLINTIFPYFCLNGRR